MQTKIINFDTAFRAYLECAAWSSRDDCGNPLDDFRFSDEAEKKLKEEFAKIVADFEEDAFPELETYIHKMSSEQFGHDLWLTRNRHGAGFWDRGIPRIEKLTQKAHGWGEVDLYLNDETMEIEID